MKMHQTLIGETVDQFLYRWLTEGMRLKDSSKEETYLPSLRVDIQEVKRGIVCGSLHLRSPISKNHALGCKALTC